MKYLKRFNESVSFEIDDILLELNDIGFKTSKSENEELGEFFINIEKDGNLPSQQIFKFSEISDSLLRLVDYLADSKLYLQYIHIDHVMLRTQSNSVFDGRHPNGVISDIANDKLSGYYQDKGGISSINPNKVTHIQLYFRK